MTVRQPLALRDGEWTCPGCGGQITATETPGLHDDPRNPQDDGAEVMLPGAALIHADGCSVISGLAG